MQELIELEKQGWQALSSKGDAAEEFYRPLLTDDAVMLFPGGMRVEGKAQILDSFGAQPWHSFQMEDARVTALSEKAAVVIYKVTAQREGSDPYVALISSTYARRAEEWKLVLHQQTPA